LIAFSRPLAFSIDQFDHCFLNPPSPVRVSLNIRDCELTVGFHAPLSSRTTGGLSVLAGEA
jgi:hypothetical protein